MVIPHPNLPTGRKWVKLGPALIITDEQLEEGVNILKQAIEEVKNEDLDL